MKILIGVILVLVTGVLSVKIEPRIVGGKKANPNDFKYQVKIIIKINKREALLCGGSVIHNNWILTAAHCLANRKFFKVFLGPKTQNSFTKQIDSKEAIIHENFSEKEQYNDIGLIKIPTIKFDDFIQKITLCQDTTSSFAGESVTLAGWGKTKKGPKSNNLQYTNLKVLNSSECKEKLKLRYRDYKLCAIDPNSSPCYGDSGGPVVTGSGANAIQIALLSFGRKNCYPNSISGHTRVAYFLSWIKSKTNINF